MDWTNGEPTSGVASWDHSPTKRTKTHAVKDSKPLCGCHPTGTYHPHSPYLTLPWIECKSCRRKAEEILDRILKATQR